MLSCRRCCRCRRRRQETPSTLISLFGRSYHRCEKKTAEERVLLSFSLRRRPLNLSTSRRIDNRYLITLISRSTHCIVGNANEAYPDMYTVKKKTLSPSRKLIELYSPRKRSTAHSLACLSVYKFLQHRVFFPRFGVRRNRNLIRDAIFIAVHKRKHIRLLFVNHSRGMSLSASRGYYYEARGMGDCPITFAILLLCTSSRRERTPRVWILSLSLFFRGSYNAKHVYLQRVKNVVCMYNMLVYVNEK